MAVPSPDGESGARPRLRFILAATRRLNNTKKKSRYNTNYLHVLSLLDVPHSPSTKECRYNRRTSCYSRSIAGSSHQSLLQRKWREEPSKTYREGTFMLHTRWLCSHWSCSIRLSQFAYYDSLLSQRGVWFCGHRVFILSFKSVCDVPHHLDDQ